MSIALATKGRLWPSPGNVIRERIMDLRAEVEDPLVVDGSIETSSISGEVVVNEICASVVVVDSLTGEIVSSDIDGDLG